MHNRAITVVHEQWMCPGMQRHTHITLCSLVVKINLITFVGMSALLVIIQPTHVGLVSLYG